MSEMNRHTANPPHSGPPRRDRLVIVGCILLIAAMAWAYLLHLDHQMAAAAVADQMMAGMGMSTDVSWTSSDVFFTFIMWAVMMVGMMSASAAPVLLLFAATRAGRGDRRVSLAVVLFGAAYVAVWTAFSAVAALAQWGLHEALLLSPTMTASSPRLGGTILLGAGIYQLSSLKGTCLAHCRSPLGFLISHWRDGVIGAFQMGLRHGAYCVGCCWALMCVLFVVGVMNLAWVAGLGIFVLLEKAAPRGGILARLAGAAMVVGGVLRLSGVA
jgi:predicted metal-binding membrane protein